MAEAIEFQTFVVKGKIDIPPEYKERVNGKVRVIILVEEKDADVDFLDYLIANLVKVTDSKPMTRDEIYSGKRFGD